MKNNEQSLLVTYNLPDQITAVLLLKTHIHSSMVSCNKKYDLNCERRELVNMLLRLCDKRVSRDLLSTYSVNFDSEYACGLVMIPGKTHFF